MQIVSSKDKIFMKSGGSAVKSLTEPCWLCTAFFFFFFFCVCYSDSKKCHTDAGDDIIDSKPIETSLGACLLFFLKLVTKQVVD